MRTLTTILVVALLLAGCASNKLASSNLDRLDEVQRSVVDAQAEQSGLLIGFAETASRDKNYLQAKLTLTQGIKDGNVTLQDAFAALDTLRADEDRVTGALLNQREQREFLVRQGERLKSLSQPLHQYITAKRSMFEMMFDRKKSKQPDALPVPKERKPSEKSKPLLNLLDSKKPTKDMDDQPVTWLAPVRME